MLGSADHAVGQQVSTATDATTEYVDVSLSQFCHQPADCRTHLRVQKYAAATYVVSKSSVITTGWTECSCVAIVGHLAHPYIYHFFPPLNPSDDFRRLAGSFLWDCAAFGERGAFCCRMPNF